MDWWSCWPSLPIRRCYRNRGYSKWDEGDKVEFYGNVHSSLDLSVSSSSKDDMIVETDTLLTLDDTILPLLESDTHFRKVYEFLCSEKSYLDEMCSTLNTYAEPLREMQSFTPEEIRILFSDLESLICCSRDLCTRLKYAITKWDSNLSQIGHLFNDEFWNLHEAYSSHYFHISRLVVNKRSRDLEFAEFCRKMESLGKPSLDSLLNMPMKCLAFCATELKEMSSNLDSNHPDMPLLLRAANKAADRLVKLQKTDWNENYLKQIQEHFPQDDLHLMDKDVQCTAGSRWRSSVAKTLIGGGFKKSLMSTSASVGSLASSPDIKCLVPERQLILNSAAKLVVGVHSRERCLFLFDDFLVIAKGRFETNFRLKNRINTSNLWVTSGSEKSLIIGWPMQNNTFVFESSFLRDLWLASLKEAIKTEKVKEAIQSVQIKIIKKDCEYTAIKSLLVSNHETASHVVERCLTEFHILDATVADFRLCVTSTEDETTFSLSGHEYPFTIWMNSLQVSAESSSDAKIQFILRSNRKTAQRLIIGESRKPVRRGRALKCLFKKPSAKQLHLKLFGRDLAELFEQDSFIPYPITQILRKLYMDGPHTDGVFRKSANHARLQAVKQALDCGESVNFAEIPVPLAAVLLKEFLRNLPNCLLSCQMYAEWMKVVAISNREEQIDAIKGLVQMLPPCNQLLLSHLMCVLCNLARHSEKCKMDSFNLAVCIGQSLLWPSASVVQKEDAQNVSILVQRMIDFATDIFGSECLLLLNSSDVLRRPKQVVVRAISADFDSMQSTGAVEDSVCNSLDLEFHHSCSEADYSPVVPDKTGFKMQSSQSCDSGLQLGDEVREGRGLTSASKIALSAKIKYFTSSESREEEDDCKQLMPKKLRHSKTKTTLGISVLQEGSSMDTLSSVPSVDSLCFHSIESPQYESFELPLGQSPLSASNVLTTESCTKLSDSPSMFVPSKRTLFFQSMLQPPARSFDMTLGQSMNMFFMPKSVKGQKKLSTNDSGVSFLGSLDHDSEENSDMECGKDVGSSRLFSQAFKSPAVEGSGNYSCSPFSYFQGRQFNQMKRRPPLLSELHGTTFAEECLEMPEELKENKLECSKSGSANSSSDSAFRTKGSSSDSGSHAKDKNCRSKYWNQNPSYLPSSEPSWSDARMNRIAEEKESKQQESSPRRPLIRANAVESDPEKLKQGMTVAGSDFYPSQTKNLLNHSTAVIDKQPWSSSHSLSDSAAKNLAFTTSTLNSTCIQREMRAMTSSTEMTNQSHPVYEKTTLEKTKCLFHHDQPNEQCLPSRVGKFSEKSLAMGEIIPHCKSLDNVSRETDSKNTRHLVQNRNPSHNSLLNNETQTQDMRVQNLEEMNCLELTKCKDISNSLYKARRPLIQDNKTDKAPVIAFKSKQFNELRSFYDRHHEKTGNLLKSTSTASKDFSSSDPNIRPRLTKKRSKNRYLRKRNSDPRLNFEGKRGSDLGRSKSDSSEHCRDSKVCSRRSEVKQSKENFNSSENNLLQKEIERSGKSMSAEDLSVSVRNVDHHNENVKKRLVTIKNRDWHKELANQYIQSSSSSISLSRPSRKSDSSSSACRFGREVKERVHKSVTDFHECTGGDDLASLYTDKTSNVDGKCFDSRLARDFSDNRYKNTSHHVLKSPQKSGTISCSLTPTIKSSHPTTPEASASVRELRENFLGLRLNADVSKVLDSCSNTHVTSFPGVDSLISKDSGRPPCETDGRTREDAKVLDLANISWSVARLKELYSSQHDQSANKKPLTSHSKSEDWCSSKKSSALPRLG